MAKGADVTGIAVELTALARARALQQARALQASLKAKYAAAADTYRTARAQARVHFSEDDLLEAGARPLPRQRRTRA
jgi:hypothetical protein